MYGGTKLDKKKLEGYTHHLPCYKIARFKLYKRTLETLFDG